MYQISDADCGQIKAILRSFCSEKGNTIKEQELRRRAVLLCKKPERKKETVIMDWKKRYEDAMAQEEMWLKSLCPPQYCENCKLKRSVENWKPSEHQMNILKAVKEHVGRGSGYWGEALGSLIYDLEKLM